MTGLALGPSLTGAFLLAAVLAPADPVLAAGLQVNAPGQGGEHPIRFCIDHGSELKRRPRLSFVYLAILLATSGSVSSWFVEWMGLYVFYKIAMNIAVGADAGWGLGHVLFLIPHAKVLAKPTSGVVAMAGVLFTYGAA